MEAGVSYIAAEGGVHRFVLGGMEGSVGGFLFHAAFFVFFSASAGAGIVSVDGLIFAWVAQGLGGDFLAAVIQSFFDERELMPSLGKAEVGVAFLIVVEGGGEV